MNLVRLTLVLSCAIGDFFVQDGLQPFVNCDRTLINVL